MLSLLMGFMLTPRKLLQLLTGLVLGVLLKCAQSLAFFKRFIQGYAILTAPLVALTSRRVEFVWGQKQQKAFTQLQWCLTNAPVLALPDPAAPYEVIVDASGVWLRCCVNAESAANSLSQLQAKRC